MSDTQNEQGRDHWAELAEQLGLSPEPAAGQPRAQARPARPTPRPEPRVERTEAPPRSEEFDQAEPTTFAPVPAESGESAEDISDQDRGHDSGEDVGEEPRRGRRGRRGGRNRRRRDEGRPETAGERPGTRQRRERIEAAADRPEGAESEAVDAESGEDAGEEVDTLSDWNVPSWAELIASLYRPER